MLGARGRRGAIALAVLVLASLIATSLAVPAFGGPAELSAISLGKRVSSSLRLAKRANKNAAKALALAKKGGPAGPTGTAGPPGPAGTQGPKGDPGPSAASWGRDADALYTDLLPANAPTKIGTLPLQPGKYVVLAKALVNNNDAAVASFTCTLAAGGTTDDTGDTAGVKVGPDGADDREMLSLMLTATLTTAGDATLTCSTSASGNIGKASIVAIAVGSVGTPVNFP